MPDKQSGRETMPVTIFKKGDKVREIKLGETYTVAGQRGSLMVFVEELSNAWIHPSNLRLVSDQADPVSSLMLVVSALGSAAESWVSVPAASVDL